MTEMKKEDFLKLDFNKDLSLEDFNNENEVDRFVWEAYVKESNGEWRELTDNELDILNEDFHDFVWEESYR